VYFLPFLLKNGSKWRYSLTVNFITFLCKKQGFFTEMLCKKEFIFHGSESKKQAASVLL